MITAGISIFRLYNRRLLMKECESTQVDISKFLESLPFSLTEGRRVQ